MKRILLSGQKTKEEFQKVIILYSTDAWHTHISRELVGVFSNQDELNKYLSKMEQAKELTDYDMSMLVSQNQTQGRDTNYLVETEKINPKYER